MPELNEYFHMNRCQLNFGMFCATSALGISWQYLNHPNSLARSVYRFHVCFHVQLIFHNLGISLPHEDGFIKRFKFKHGEDEKIQQQNFSEQHRHEIGWNNDISKDHKKLRPPDMSKNFIPVIRHDNLKMLTEKHNDEKLVITLLIVRPGLINYHFW